MFLATAVLAMAMSVTGASKKTEVPVESFSHKYFAQLDKTNAALRDYANVDCKSPEFKGLAKNLEKQLTYIKGMYENIPLDVDEIESTHVIESYIGLVIITNKSIDKQNECIDPLHENTPSEKGQ